MFTPISRYISEFIQIGDMSQLTQSTKSILNIFEPIIFPIAISVSFLRAAITEVASSGRLVQTATIVSPIISSLIPRLSAICVAPSTIHFHHKTSQMSQMMIEKTEEYILCCC